MGIDFGGPYTFERVGEIGDEGGRNQWVHIWVGVYIKKHMGGFVSDSNLIGLLLDSGGDEHSHLQESVTQRY